MKKIDLNPTGRWAAMTAIGVLLLATAQAQTISISKLWQIPTDQSDSDYATPGSTERGAAINPVTGHILLVSRASGLNVVVLDGDTGEEVGQLDLTDVTGGTFPLSTIGVAEDGVIYAANLVSPAADTRMFRIYRWADESSLPTVAFEGNPALFNGNRFGDSLDVRGAGAGTQIAAGAGNNVTATRFAVFTTEDGTNFVAHAFAPAGVNATTTATDLQKGVAFGAGDTLFGKANGTTGRFISFNLANDTASLVTNVPLPGNLSPIAVDPVNNLLAGVNYFTHELLIYDVYDRSAPVPIGAYVFPAPVTANANGVGALDFGAGKLVALDTQNGVMAFKVEISTTPAAPQITVQPASQTVLEGGAITLAVGAIGTRPFSYQWLREGTPIADATNASLVLKNIAPAAAGNYAVEVTNPIGPTTSSNAVLTVTALVKSENLTPLWALAPGARPWLGTDNNQRGMAYNPARNHVLVVSRTGGTNIVVLDGDTGAELHKLTVTADITGGTFVANMVGVSDDGAVYVGNLSTSTTAPNFKLYRWENDNPETLPTIAFQGDPAAGASIQRWGDNMDLRGGGVDTQVLIASRNSTNVAILTTADGLTFDSNLIAVPDATAGNFGLGVAFGKGDTFWGKSSAQSLRQVKFDLAAATGLGETLVNFPAAQFPSTVFLIGVDPANDFLAGLSVENPDNVRLYDLSKLPEPPVLIDQEFTPADNENLNGTGAVHFGGGKLFVLDSNNGLAAYTVRKVVPPPAKPTLSAPKLAGANFEFTLAGEIGRTYIIEASSDLRTWAEVGRQTADQPTVSVSIATGAAPHRFYRASVNP